MRHYDPAPFFPEKRTLRPHTVSKDSKVDKAHADMLKGTASYECEENGHGEAKCDVTRPPKVGTK